MRFVLVFLLLIIPTAALADKKRAPLALSCERLLAKAQKVGFTSVLLEPELLELIQQKEYDASDFKKWLDTIRLLTSWAGTSDFEKIEFDGSETDPTHRMLSEIGDVLYEIHQDFLKKENYKKIRVSKPVAAKWGIILLKGRLVILKKLGTPISFIDQVTTYITLSKLYRRHSEDHHKILIEAYKETQSIENTQYHNLRNLLELGIFRELTKNEYEKLSAEKPKSYLDMASELLDNPTQENLERALQLYEMVGAFDSRVDAFWSNASENFQNKNPNLKLRKDLIEQLKILIKKGSPGFMFPMTKGVFPETIREKEIRELREKIAMTYVVQIEEYLLDPIKKEKYEDWISGSSEYVLSKLKNNLDAISIKGFLYEYAARAKFKHGRMKAARALLEKAKDAFIKHEQYEEAQRILKQI